MDIVFFAHPVFIDSQSMPRFATMLEDGMARRGHKVTIWVPKPVFTKLAFLKYIKKWLGYIDQYIVFPIEVKRLLKDCPKNTLFVFTDHALGPWVPLVAGMPHVIHCHDFLAQRSALHQIPENITGWSGRQYQKYIRDGYTKGKNFISVSQKTRDDLHKFLPTIPTSSEMVYNGLNRLFIPGDAELAVNSVSKKFGIDLSQGYILHVGGNQWYKNRLGVIEIYNAWRMISKLKLPLLLIGEKASEDLLSAFSLSAFKQDIHFVSGVDDEYVRLAYSGASVFLFPSLAEGFGWPIAEAMASACPVITTNEVPMTEVAGDEAFTVRRRPHDQAEIRDWAIESANVVEQVLTLSPDDRRTVIEKGILNAKRFDPKNSLDKIEMIYLNILQSRK